MADCLLRHPPSGGDLPPAQHLGKLLGTLLVKVLFEMWLHSRTLDPDLWGSLTKLVNGWLHHMPLSIQWYVVIVVVLCGACSGVSASMSVRS